MNMERRKFIKNATLGSVILPRLIGGDVQTAGCAQAQSDILSGAQPAIPGKENNKWYKSSTWRNLIDMHIPDWNPEFLTKFSPEDYAQAMVDAQVDALVWLIRRVRTIYGDVPVRTHNELAATACPGRFFPAKELTCKLSPN